MNLRKPQLWIAAISATAVLLVAVVDLGRTSPGPLTAVHEREPELAGRRDCSECHGGWMRSMSAACLDCHADIRAQMEAHEGLHGVIGENKARQCAPCHSEHHGTGFAIVNRQSFAQAGVADPAKFDHQVVGFLMDGKHLELDCIQCHSHANELVLEKGTRRYIGLDQDCTSCHEDPHEGRMAAGCAECHGQETWEDLRSLGHERVLPLIGGHGDLDCRKCHADDTLRSLDEVGGRGKRLPARTCQECHESPHDEGFVSGVARQVSLAGGASCVTCHVPEHVSFRQEGLEVTAEQHASSGFFLVPPHDEVGCGECHPPETGEFAGRYPGRAADDCMACHEDPHGGQFDDSFFATRDCLACHDPQHFEPHVFTPEKHALTALELTGRHLEIECSQCHLDPPEGKPRSFHGTEPRCEACHEDAHADFFVRFQRGLRLPPLGPCAQCHLTTTFTELPAEGFDHERWTGFAVAGAHAQAECEICHERTSEPDQTGRAFGRVAEQFGAYTGCVTCHEDAHEGLFDAGHLPREVDGLRDCARCHVETSFRAFPQGFDHERWTAFPLLGAHAQIDCADCHAPLFEPRSSGRTWGAAKGNRCSDCHADPHEGQFAVNGRIDCQRCHAATRSFNVLSFEHDLDSRFSLGEAHEEVACAACHPRFTPREGISIVRYRPLPMECADCHGVHEMALPSRQGRKP